MSPPSLPSTSTCCQVGLLSSPLSFLFFNHSSVIITLFISMLLGLCEMRKALADKVALFEAKGMTLLITPVNHHITHSCSLSSFPSFFLTFSFPIRFV
jgi:hypothetical protein